MHQTLIRSARLLIVRNIMSKTYRYSNNVKMLPFFKHDFQMFIAKYYQGKNQKKMLQSQNEWSRSRLNKTLLV